MLAASALSFIESDEENDHHPRVSAFSGSTEILQYLYSRLFGKIQIQQYE
jgi:hypothetical protein